MQIVGDYLRDHALSLQSGDRDSFARSAFNRYYYAAFLQVRSLVIQIRNGKFHIAHSAFPTFLETSFQSEFQDRLEKARKRRSITEGEMHRYKSNVRAAIRALAKLLAESYSLRCIADYEPSTKIVVSSSDFTLVGCSVRDAQIWPRRASQYCGLIVNVWSIIGN